MCALVGSKGEALLEGNKPDSYMEQVCQSADAICAPEPWSCMGCHVTAATLLLPVLLWFHLLSHLQVVQVNGRSMAAAGCEPILHMRDFQKLKRLPEALEVDIYSRLGACDISAGPGACG